MRTPLPYFVLTACAASLIARADVSVPQRDSPQKLDSITARELDGPYPSWIAFCRQSLELADCREPGTRLACHPNAIVSLSRSPASWSEAGVFRESCNTAEVHEDWYFVGVRTASGWFVEPLAHSLVYPGRSWDLGHMGASAPPVFGPVTTRRAAKGMPPAIFVRWTQHLRGDTWHSEYNYTQTGWKLIGIGPSRVPAVLDVPDERGAEPILAGDGTIALTEATQVPSVKRWLMVFP